MKAILKNKLLVAATLAIALFASYSCEDNDVYIFPELPQSELTALEIMQQDPDFADFLAVVDLCGPECADSLFNQSRIYTIFAPVSLPVSEIEERIANGDREGVFKEYIESHVANFRHAANGDVEKKLLMLNDKLIEFVGPDENGKYAFGNSTLAEVNIQAKNAIIHKISEPFAYKPSLWEALKNVDLISSFWNFCKKYTKKEFDPSNSIPGDIVNQEPTYRDSAFVESNEMQRIMGSINNEDSLMIMYVPSNDLWEEICSTAETYFNYDTVGYNKKQREEADSIRKLRGIKSYLEYITYSLSDQRLNGQITDLENLPDSLAVRKVTYPRKKYPRAEFNIIDSKESSNGILNVVDAMPVNPYNLWVDTIRLEPDAKDGDGFANVKKVGDKYKELKNDNALYDVISVSEKEQNPDVKGKLSNGRYLRAYQSDVMKANNLPHMTFLVKDVLSTKYKIALITPPWFIKSYKDTILLRSDDPPYADSFLRVTVKQNGEVLGMFPSDSVDVGGKYSVPMEKAIRPDKSRIDTIFLKDETGEDFIFDFKTCENYSGLYEIQPNKKENINKFYTVEIKVELVAPAVLDEWWYELFEEELYMEATDGFAYRFLLDQIMLVPVNPADSETPAGN